MLGTIAKRVADILVYTVDFEDWLNTGDAIASAVWTVPSGLTDVTDASTSTTASVKVSGGTAGTSYTLTVTMVTSVSSETKVESFVLKVKA